MIYFDAVVCPDWFMIARPTVIQPVHTGVVITCVACVAYSYDVLVPGI